MMFKFRVLGMVLISTLMLLGSMAPALATDVRETPKGKALEKCIKEVSKSKVADFSKCEKQYRELQAELKSAGNEKTKEGGSFWCWIVATFCDGGRQGCSQMGYPPEECKKNYEKCVKQGGCTPEK